MTRALPSAASIASGRKQVRGACAPGVDPAVVHLLDIAKPLAGYWGFVADKAGLDRRCMARWFAAQATPSVPNLRAVLNALGYDLTITKI